MFKCNNPNATGPNSLYFHWLAFCFSPIHIVNRLCGWQFKRINCLNWASCCYILFYSLHWANIPTHHIRSDFNVIYGKWMTLTNNCGLLEWRFFIGNKSQFVSYICVLSSLPENQIPHTLDLIWLPCLAFHVRIVQARQLFGKRRWISSTLLCYTHCLLQVSWFYANRLNMFVFISDTDKSPHWFCPLSFSIWWYDSRRAGWKIQTHTHTHVVLYVWTRASSACNFQ